MSGAWIKPIVVWECLIDIFFEQPSFLDNQVPCTLETSQVKLCHIEGNNYFYIKW